MALKLRCTFATYFFVASKDWVLGILSKTLMMNLFRILPIGGCSGPRTLVPYLLLRALANQPEAFCTFIRLLSLNSIFIILKNGGYLNWCRSSNCSFAMET